jgi:hypothetical protein
MGHRVVLVSSGAVGVGLKKLNLDKRPKHLPQIQVRLVYFYLFLLCSGVMINTEL